MISNVKFDLKIIDESFHKGIARFKSSLPLCIVANLRGSLNVPASFLCLTMKHCRAQPAVSLLFCATGRRVCIAKIAPNIMNLEIFSKITFDMHILQQLL